FLQQKNIDAEIFKKLSNEIDRKFGVESLIGIADKDNIEELYFCVAVPTEVSEQTTSSRINDALNFPLLYDQLEDGKRTKFIAIELNELREVINQTESQTKQSTEVETTDGKASDTNNPIEKDISAAVPMKVKREEWEKQMLKLALMSLKENPANAGEEIQTATFADGKYRVIHHVPSEMLRIVDEENHRGTLYKVQKEKPVQVCKFTEDEKRSFEHDVKQQHLKDLQQE
ncbi:MAG: hypothetical protein HC907_24920, partial [Richelia sp. SM1_7_0]|nr:hypothetical protein [Richelia sp. SM1_7_0]